MEIERKFLVTSDDWKKNILKSEKITQFYLTGLDQSPTVRLRIKGNKGFLTLKYPSQSTEILAREEFEYEIPVEDVRAQLDQAVSKVINKVRHEVPGPDGKLWEVDEFWDPAPGLVLAEIELDTEQEGFELPGWAGEEVTNDNSYSNLRLSFDKS